MDSLIKQREDYGALPMTVVLVGLMGAGKTSVGKLLAERLGVKFLDADKEIESAAGCSISDFFARFGEEEFRRGEERVIARLLKQPACVLATGGGAFMSLNTRKAIRTSALSIWLKADLDVLFERISRRSDRPLLQTVNPRQTLQSIMDQRYPIYSQADLVVESVRGPLDQIVERVGEMVAEHFKTNKETRP